MPGYASSNDVFNMCSHRASASVLTLLNGPGTHFQASYQASLYLNSTIKMDGTCILCEHQPDADADADADALGVNKPSNQFI